MDPAQIVSASYLIGVLSLSLSIVLGVATVSLRRHNARIKRSMQKEPVNEAVQRLEREAAEIQAKADTGSEFFDTLRERYATVTSKLRAIEVGLTPPVFKFDDREELKREIAEVRRRQLEVILAGKAVTHRSEWTVSDSKTDGARMTKAYKRLALRAFNDEFEVIRRVMRHSSADTALKKLWRLQEQLDKLGDPVGVHLEDEYVLLKQQELLVWKDNLQRKEREKQAIKDRRALLKAQGGSVNDDLIDELDSDLEEKERALERARAQAQKLFDQANRAQQKEIESLQREIERLRAKQERALSQAQLTRAGYIYVISNIGSFGEGIVKIGLTRRLEPMDRVKELGDASVPFRFDVHTIAFANDAPTIERTLHRKFDALRVNTENSKKEFFRVSPQQVQSELEQLQVDSDWYFEVEAREYRESILRREAMRVRQASLAQQEVRLAELPEVI